MPTVTVQGANASTLSLVYDSQPNADLAILVREAINAGILSALTPAGNGSILPVDRAQTPVAPLLPAGKTGEYVFSTPGLATMPRGYDFVVVTAPVANLTGNGDSNQQVLAGASNLTFNAGGVATGAGSVITGGGNNSITIPVTDSGSWLIAMGNGNDTVRALGGGNDTIVAGAGTNRITLGGGHSVVTTAGSASIVGSSLVGSSETVTASGNTVITANRSNLMFIGNAGAGATVFGGTGSDTIQGGGGPNYFQGGSAGNNSILGGSGTATLFGGGSGDKLFAGSGAGALQELHAGLGNETLTGTSGLGNDTFFGGAGSATVYSGAGANHYVAGQALGSMEVHVDSLTGGFQSSSNQFDFIFGQGGGSVQATGFTTAGQIKFHLIGAGWGGNSTAQLAQNAVIGSDLHVTLSDNTQVTFLNIANVLTTGSNFV